ncbi:MAG: hypothetical protein M3N15_04790 [Actinomycetota bacterium]|nr:hypothetical protein [Actinomycetota bacterium]
MAGDDEVLGGPGAPEHDARQEELMREGAEAAATETTTRALAPDEEDEAATSRASPEGD